jgi:ribosomal protein S18 acetylase RimI-like enzyme
MEEVLHLDGAWPSPVTITRGWSRARARPWNADSADAFLRLERGGTDFLLHATHAVLDLGVGTVMSPPLYTSATRVWRRGGYDTAHRLQVMERSLASPSLPPVHSVLPASDPDWKRIVEIDDAAFHPFWRLGRLGLQEALSSTRRSVLLIARRDGEVAGYAIVGSQWGAAYLQRIAVDPIHAGTGVGSDLVRTALAWGRPSSPTMVLNVHAENSAARRLYAREGFRDTGTTLHILRFER